MHKKEYNRRRFLLKASAGAAGLSLAASSFLTSRSYAVDEKGPLALLGGKPVRSEPFPSWPLIEKNDREGWQQVLEDKKWCRLDGGCANRFEKVFAQRMGTQHCTVTANGTSALLASLNALGVGPGDEVLVPPYTFVATINVVLLQYALPIFIDTDRATFQMDATKIEPAITPKTKCIIPVHLGGNAADMDTILKIARKHSLPVVEDACQAHFGEWRKKKLGSVGTCGCFSFQVTKNLSAGEGGAIISNDGNFMEKCFAFHNNGRGRARTKGDFSYPRGGANLRMTEFQAALLLQQITRVEEQSKIRDDNADYLLRQIQNIPGILPAKSYQGCTRNAWHIFMFRYEKEKFAEVPLSKFLKALHAEGIPCSSGYGPLNKEPFLKESLNSRGYAAVYPEERLKLYWKTNHCPENDKLCEEAVWMGQTTLLGNHSDMDQIAGAIRKILNNAPALAKA